MHALGLAQLLLLGAAVAALPLAWAWVRGDADKYRRLVWVTTFLTFDLILFGAFTRLTDSGLGCPDWPGCYGHSNPVAALDQIRAAERALPDGPVTLVKAWIEMLHRYFAMGVGALITALMILAWTGRRRFGRSPWPATALFALVCVQGAFGAWTVTLKLMPLVVTVHLLLAIVLLCALGLIGARMREATPALPRRPVLPRAAALALILVAVQIALGGWVSTNYAVLACQDFPLCNGAWIPEMEFGRAYDLTRPLGRNDDGSLLPVQALVAIHWVHRTFAWIVLGVLAWLCLLLWRDGDRAPWLRRQALTLAGLALLQVGTGISNVVFAWPLAVAVIHNGGAAAMALVLALLNFRLAGGARRASRAAPADAAA
ncbi:MAG: COX15/CtaA family protein [Burkholderiales bacterium]|nr:COX15/CtaA family protein [Burkholderiales bacterium]